MPHVITQSCCSDASCVYACPVNCIQPTPDDPGFVEAEMLHIDPSACVDCGACVSACPVAAIKPHHQLTDAEELFRRINAEYFGGERRRERPLLAPVTPPLVVRRPHARLRVAVVGSGPAAMYAADEVLTIPGARVDVYERLDQPYGLARFGVAPDHRLTRRVTRQLAQIAANPRLSMHLNAEVGRCITHEQLLGGHDAVVYAVGANADRRLEIPGAGMPGTASATEFVAWYNGHPDAAGRTFELDHERVVVIGNGNVALDVARILTADPSELARTDIAPRALTALRRSSVREVVVVGRRGPEHSAFTLPELIGLANAPGIDLRVSRDELAGVPADGAKLELLGQLAARDAEGHPRTVRLRYRRTPLRIAGGLRATGVEFRDPEGATETIEAGLVLSSIGYRGVPLPGLPFDAAAGTIPNEAGRVLGVPRTYVAGWIKRGPSGFIGTNRTCAQETIRSLVEDWDAGRLAPTGSPAGPVVLAA
jgi:ferredoxin--NADP+ reductase